MGCRDGELIVETNESVLRARVLNCLQTILDLEPELEKHALAERLIAEFQHLKRTIRAIDSLELREADVERIERSTADFLEQIKVPLILRGGGADKREAH